MNVGKHPTFYYHADANGLGGTLSQPLTRIVSTEASVSLAQAGGFTSRQIDKFHLDGLVSIDAAHVHVGGGEHRDDGGHRTIATARVDKLNVLDVITADSIVAQVSLLHPYDRSSAFVSLIGSQFVNLRVNGCLIEPKVDPRLFLPYLDETEGHGTQLESGAAPRDHATVTPRLSDLLRVAEKQHEEGAKQQAYLVEKFGPRFAITDPRTSLEQNGDVLCTLVQPVEATAPAEGYGRVIHVPDFGNIFLGELRVSPFAAELTMLRIEMGCVATGTVSAASVRPNGRWAP
jgi:hypothetical protein